MARTVILGQSGRGKSWYLGKYLEDTVPKFTHGVHFDIENEEGGLTRKGQGGEPPVYKAWYIDQQGLENWSIKQTVAQNGKLRVVPDGLTREEMVELLGQICDAAMTIAKKEDYDFHLSVDEAHNVIPGTAIDERISRALTGGRKRGLEWAISTQRAQKLHEDALSQSNFGVYFQMTKDRDLKKVDGSTGFNAEEKLKPIGKREAIIEDADRGEWDKVSTDSLSRAHPHVAGDDGKADEFLAVGETDTDTTDAEPDEEAVEADEAPEGEPDAA